jgi:hypothetical protein
VQSGPKLKPWPVGLIYGANPARLGGVAFALALTSCARAGLLLAPISCLARAITLRAPSADRLRGAIGATQNTLQSLSCQGQYGCSVVKGVPPAPDCPCIALASCLARAAHRLTDPHVHAQTTSEFLRQPELSAPVGGRALGRRSEGSLLAAELLRAGLEPGVQPLCRLDGLMPVQPCPRCAPARPPRKPACAAARVRAPALPVPARHGPSLDPLSHNQQHLCAHIRAGLDESF